jgi:hypothetical protein
LFFFTAAKTFAQSPPLTKLTVVAPLCPKFVPIAPLTKVVRNPFPHPPPLPDGGAVVESPARKKAAGFALLSTPERGDAATIDQVARKANVERRMAVKMGDKMNDSETGASYKEICLLYDIYQRHRLNHVDVRR